MALLTQITVPQNNDVTVGLTVLEEDDATAQDCTGLTPVMYVKASQNSDDTRAVTLTLGTGLFWVEQNGGLLTAVLSHVLLAAAGNQWWRLDLTDASTPPNITSPMFGPLTITPC
jgi:hypothetical protein